MPRKQTLLYVYPLLQEQLLRNGVAWLDSQGSEMSYWFPGLVREVSMTADDDDVQEP
jgi:hypothetical protein